MPSKDFHQYRSYLLQSHSPKPTSSNSHSRSSKKMEKVSNHTKHSSASLMKSPARKASNPSASPPAGKQNSNWYALLIFLSSYPTPRRTHHFQEHGSTADIVSSNRRRTLKGISHSRIVRARPRKIRPLRSLRPGFSASPTTRRRAVFPPPPGNTPHFPPRPKTPPKGRVRCILRHRPLSLAGPNRPGAYFSLASVLPSFYLFSILYSLTYSGHKSVHASLIYSR
jgi:hypothetical protein